MIRTILAAMLALSAIPPAWGATAEPAPKAPSRLTLDLSAEAYAGAFDGLGVREESGAMSILALRAKPALRRDGFTLEVPMSLAHRQTFGADLSQTAGSVGIEPWWQLSPRLRAGLDAELLGARRPGWPDLYGRDPVTGALPPTDRYGFLAGRLGVQAWARPAPRQHLRARYRVALYDYVDDPLFDELLEPYHLTPRDRLEHEIDVSWRLVRRAWALALRGDYTYRVFSKLPSRPSPAVGTAPDQRLHLLEPSAELELRPLGGKLDLSFRYGYLVQRDPYRGYYTLGGHHPRVVARLAASDRLTLGVRWEGRYEEYGPAASTRVDGAGPRRSDLTELGAEAELRIGGGFSLRAEGEWVRRTTNYRDYVPPASRFDIDFDYVNLSALAGIAWRR